MTDKAIRAVLDSQVVRGFMDRHREVESAARWQCPECQFEQNSHYSSHAPGCPKARVSRGAGARPVSADVSDCIAMSENGDWYAFPKTMSRGQVMAVMAENCMSWHDALSYYRVLAGHVHRPSEPPEDGWWEECASDAPGARPSWIVSRR